MRTTFRTVLLAGLALGLVALFLAGADLREVEAALAAADWRLLAGGVGITVGVYVLRTLRWQYLLEPVGVARFGPAFRATVIGYTASFVLPARVGEIVRPSLLARREGLDTPAVLATVVVERVLDLVSVLVMLAAYLAWFDTDAAARAPALMSAVTIGAAVATPVAFGLLVLMGIVAGRPERVEAWLVRVAAWLPAWLAARLAGAARTFAEGCGVVRRPRRLLVSLVLSLAVWAVICSETWIVARAMGLDLPYAGSYLVMVLLVIGVAIPTPGGIGGFHEAFRLGVTAFFGAPNDLAVATAIVLHAVSFAPVLALGAAAVAREGLALPAASERTSA